MDNLIEESRILHNRLSEANIFHLFIIEIGEDEPRVGGHGTLKWQGDNLIKAAQKIDKHLKEIKEN